jgi:hypothetical protein
MSSRLFASFRSMVDSIPPRAILRAVQAEQRMLENDLAQKRLSPTEECLSILSFCDLLESVSRGSPVCFPGGFPVEHCSFYRRVIQMLEDEGEVPAGSCAQFDAAVSPSLLKSLIAS